MRLVLTLLFLPLTAFGTLTVTDKGATCNAVSASSDAMSPTSGNTIAAGSTGVLIIEADNAGGVSTTNFPAIGTLVTDSVGNKWRLRLDQTTGANANAGVETAIYTCSNLTTALTPSDNVTVSYTLAIGAKCWQFYQVSANAGNIALPVAQAGSASSSSAPTITTGPSINIGDVIIGAEGIEGNVAVTGDNDTTNGTWQPVPAATPYGAATGSGLTAMQVASQYKVISTAIATQTFNLAFTGPLDQTISWISLTEIDAKGRRVVTTTANATSWAISPSDPLAVGSLGVLVLATDNAGASGNTANINSAVAGTPPGQGAGSILGTTGFDSQNNTWTLRVTGINTASGLNGGSELAIFTAPITTALNPTDTITIPFGATCTAKSAVMWEFAATTTPTYVAGGDNGTTSIGTPVATTSSITSGDIVIGGGAAEGGNTWATATDNTNGTWLSPGSQSQGTGAASMAVMSQYKITTGTGAQTFNPTLTAADVHIGWISIHPPSVGPTAAQKSAFFMLFP